MEKPDPGAILKMRKAMRRDGMIQKIAHIGVAVKDMEETERFYTEVLSLGISGRESVGEINITIIPVGDTMIELLQSTTPDGVISKFIDEKGAGIHHIAYQVDDIDKALEDLKAKGVRLIDEQPRGGIHNSRIAFLSPQSSYGVAIELVEHKKKS